MFYVVRWPKDSAVISEVRFEYLLEAKAHAQNRFYVQKVRCGVTAAEVADVEGIIYFRFDGR